MIKKGDIYMKVKEKDVKENLKKWEDPKCIVLDSKDTLNSNPYNIQSDGGATYNYQS